MSSISVLKFGGTSVKNIGRINHVVDIIAKKRTAKQIVVVSAMGDTTDYLYGLAKQCSSAPDKRELDMLLSTGEQISIALLTIILKDRGIKAKSFTGSQIGIVTDNTHSCARILDISGNVLKDALRDYDVLVVAGFQGLSENGEITTLGRGGSDTSAVALAAATGSNECHIYTDVDGIFTSDPNKIQESTLIETLSYSETIELARAGAQVLHPRAAELARYYGIKLRIRNTFNPDNVGTLITGARDVEKLSKVKAVAVDSHQAYVLLTNVPTTFPILAECETLFAKEDISIDVVSQTNLNEEECLVQLALRYSDADILQCRLKELQTKSCAEDLTADFDVTRISLVGSGIGSASAIRTRALGLLTTACIQVRLFSSSESTISFLVNSEHAKRAADLLHHEFLGAQQVSATYRNNTEVPLREVASN
jgi:aspartate kinase